MSPVQLQHSGGDDVRRLWEISHDATDLPETSEKGFVRHPINFRGRSHIGERHFAVGSFGARTCEQVYFVGIRWVVVFLSSGEDRKSPVDALGALAAVRVESGHVAHACAAARMADQITATVQGDPPDHLRLGKPNEWVRNVKVSVEDRAKNASEAGQRLWVSSPGCACAHDLSDRG